MGFDRETGATLVTIPVPALQPTAGWIGGEDLGDLYITTEAQNVNEADRVKYPLSGGLFRCRSRSKYHPAVAFLG